MSSWLTALRAETIVRDLHSAADEMRQRLSLVTDPELDQAVTELGFIQDVKVDLDNQVRHLETTDVLVRGQRRFYDGAGYPR